MKKILASLLAVVLLTAGTAMAQDKPEVDTVRWARANSGNVLVTLAKNNGYLKDVGINVIEIPLNSTSDALTALNAKQVDVTSNNGTNNPLQFMAKGSDFTIVGGYMLKGMYIVARKGTGWHGVSDFIGKKIAAPKSQTWITGPLMWAGYNIDDVTWLTYSTNSDRLTSVIKGEADVVWAYQLQPNYGCCRMNMNSDFVKANPKTVKLLLKALIRSEQYLLSHPDESVKILAKELHASEDFVAAYLKNPNYRPSVDPVRNAVKATWKIMMDTGFLPESAKNYDLDAHINVDLYKEALDELIAERYDEDPAFYDDRIAFFKANNF